MGFDSADYDDLSDPDLSSGVYGSSRDPVAPLGGWSPFADQAGGYGAVDQGASAPAAGLFGQLSDIVPQSVDPTWGLLAAPTDGTGGGAGSTADYGGLFSATPGAGSNSGADVPQSPEAAASTPLTDVSFVPGPNFQGLKPPTPLSQFPARALADRFKQDAIAGGQTVAKGAYDFTPYQPPAASTIARFTHPSAADLNPRFVSTSTPEAERDAVANGRMDADQLQEASTLAGLPDHIRQVLGAGGVIIVRTPSATGDYAPFRDYEMAQARRDVSLDARAHVDADGKPNGDTVLNVPGIYAPAQNAVILATDRAYNKSGAPREGSVSMDDHETLHALDQVLGRLSGTSDFMHAWAADKDKLSSPGATRYYSVGKGGQNSLDGALSESFAESGAMYYKTPKVLLNQAPALYDYWSRLDAALKAHTLPNAGLNRDGSSKPAPEAP